MDENFLALAYNFIIKNEIIDEDVKTKLGEPNASKLQKYMDKINSFRCGNENSLTIDEQAYLYKEFGNDCLSKIMLVNPLVLGLAYKFVSDNLELNEQYETLLQQRGINVDLLQDYINRIDSYRHGEESALTEYEQQFLGNERLDKIKIMDISSNNKGNSNAKKFVLRNGNKQLGVDDEAAFSDIYMFAFLVLLFQVLFLIISYMIFSK